MSATEQQQGAIDNAENYNLIVSLAGSGKSYTLIQMAKRILKKNSNAKITFVTFTNLSTKDMKKKLSETFTVSEQLNFTVSTFHALFLNQSRGYVKGRLLVGGAQENMVSRAKRSAGYDDDSLDVDAAVGVIEYYNSKLNPAEHQDSGYWDLFCEYKALKKKHFKFDLDDATRVVCNGLKDKTIGPIDTDYLLVDESQDMDSNQSIWVNEHAKTGIKVSLVGDDDQAIYSWRSGQKVSAKKTMLDFKKQFKADIHILSKCFRCRPEILGAAQKLIEKNKERIPKNMMSAKDKGGVVKLHELKNQEEQYEKVIEMIKKAPKGWSILSRNNRYLKDFHTILLSEGIEAKLLGGKNIWDEPKVDSLLKLLYTIRFLDDNKFLHEVLGYLEEDENVIDDCLMKAKKCKGFVNIESELFYRVGTDKFLNFLRQDTTPTTSYDLIKDRVFSLLSIIGQAQNKTDDQLPLEKFILNLLLTGKGNWHDRIDTILKKLNRNDYEKEETDKEKEERIEAEKYIVQLATFHGSKGLEWEKVILLDFISGIMPPKDTIELKKIEEERRLAYVGFTRAEEELHIMSYGGEKKRSLFVVDLMS
jgi:superfamily I DNA/RNA helicase